MRNRAIAHRINALEKSTYVHASKILRFHAFGTEESDSDAFKAKVKEAVARDREGTGFDGLIWCLTCVCGQWHELGGKSHWGLCKKCRPMGRCQYSQDRTVPD